VAGESQVIKITRLDLPDIEKSREKALRVVANVMREDMNVFVPQDTGNLQQSSRSEPTSENIIITWASAYAKKWFYTYTADMASKSSNKQATRLWHETAKDKFMAKWQRIIGKEM
jgi:hypothetical protein